MASRTSARTAAAAYRCMYLLATAWLVLGVGHAAGLPSAAASEELAAETCRPPEADSGPGPCTGAASEPEPADSGAGRPTPAPLLQPAATGDPGHAPPPASLGRALLAYLGPRAPNLTALSFSMDPVRVKARTGATWTFSLPYGALAGHGTARAAFTTLVAKATITNVQTMSAINVSNPDGSLQLVRMDVLNLQLDAASGGVGVDVLFWALPDASAALLQRLKVSMLYLPKSMLAGSGLDAKLLGAAGFNPYGVVADFNAASVRTIVLVVRLLSLGAVAGMLVLRCVCDRRSKATVQPTGVPIAGQYVLWNPCSTRQEPVLCCY